MAYYSQNQNFFAKYKIYITLFFSVVFLFRFKTFISWIKALFVPKLETIDLDLSYKGRLTNSMVDALALRLYNAMDGFGTDENTLLEVYRLLEKCDREAVVSVYNAFGTHKYSLVGEFWFVGNEMNLIEWLKAELKNSSPILKNYLSLFSKYGLF